MRRFNIRLLCGVWGVHLCKVPRKQVLCGPHRRGHKTPSQTSVVCNVFDMFRPDTPHLTVPFWIAATGFAVMCDSEDRYFVCDDCHNELDR